MAALPDPVLCVITDAVLDAASLERIVARACTRPLVVQIRRPSDGGAVLYSLALRLREITHSRDCTLIVNDRIDIALAVGADGVHLPSTGMVSERARALVGERLLGRSVHSLAEIEHERELAAVDYLQFGPVFSTPSKARYGAPQGLEALAAAVASAAPLPVVAVGGIDADRVAAVVETGARGIAVIGAVMQAADPSRSVRDLADALAAAQRAA